MASIDRECCVLCGRQSYWHSLNGKVYCWPDCQTMKDIEEGRAVWGENGNVVYLREEPC